MRCSINKTVKLFPHLMDVVNYFNEGIQHYQAAIPSDAVAQFEQALRRHPWDKLRTSRVANTSWQIPQTATERRPG